MVDTVEIGNQLGHAKQAHKALDGMVEDARVSMDKLIEQRKGLMNSMTNWQRTQALKEVKGDFTKLSVERMQHFASLPHHKKKA